ncbi:MAG TPA: HDOD domain-containing protein [Planctomycetaceae bacterium]|jgi:HD-like signal output (HDOD) protein|nr:HDOD domain-containing protein [Planctomycetaceae bacterium]
MSTQATQSTTPCAGDSTGSLPTSTEPEATKKRVAAIFRRDRAQSAALATCFQEAGVDATSPENAEALRSLFSSREMDLLVLDNELEGFFSGLEVIKKLRSTLIRVPAILLNRNSESGPIDARSAGAVTVVDAATEEASIVRVGLGILERKTNEADGIPERARAIVERQTDLPVLSQLTMQLLQYLEMSPEQVPVADLCRLISIDPRATAVLLKAANASMNGMSRSISNVVDAVRVLGVRPTIGHVLNAAVTSGLGALSKSVPSELQAWHARRGMFIACTTSSFGQELENRSDEAAFLLGILQDVGILALLRGFPKQYQAVLRRWRTIGQLKLPALEQADFGCTHAEVSAAMMERWGMPASFIPAVLHHLKPQETAARLGIDTGLLRVMTIAECLADLIELPHPSRRHALNTVLAEYGAERSALCLRSLSRASAKASEAFQLLSLPLPSADQLETIVRSTITNNLSAVAEEMATAAAAT